MFWRRTNQDFNIHLVDVKNEKNNVLLAGVSLPPSLSAFRVSLAPKTPFPFPSKCLPHRLLQSVLVVRCSVTVWIVGVRQAFNKCKLIFSFSKIYLACTVYVAFARHVPRFSQMNGVARQFILWIKLVAVLCKSWWRLWHLSC